MVFRVGTSPPTAPACVMVYFGNYDGPTFWADCVPIVPISRQIMRRDRVIGTRCQLPLKLAWAFTVHKSQGLTLDKVSVALGDDERTAGLAYVALSRVRDLPSLHFKEFCDERLLKLGRSQRARRDFEDKLTRR